MPRAIDPSLPAGGLPITHSPLNRIRYNVIPQDFDLAAFLEEVLEGTIDAITNQLFPAIEELTGIDLSVLLPLINLLDLDFSSPAAFLTSLFEAIMALPAALVQVVTGVINELTNPDNSEQLTELLGALLTLLISLPSMLIQLGQSLLSSGAGLLGLDSGLNALNLFNLVPTNLLGQLNFSNIGETFTNLIADANFLDVASLSGITGWIHNLTGGFGGTGAMFTTANGTLKELFGNLIPVSEGQVLPITGRAKWTGLIGSGNPIALAVTGYNTAGATVNQTTVASHNTTPTTTDWTMLSGSYTVPAGVSAIRTRLSVLSTATAGTVGFSTLSASKSQSVFQRLIAGQNPGENLTNDISHLFGGIVTNTLDILTKASQGDFNDLLSTLGGSFGDAIEDVEDRLNDFLGSLSPLNGSNITNGSILEDFIPGIGNIHDIVVQAVGNLTGSGFDLSKMFETLTGQTHAVVDNGAGITSMFSRLSNLESRVSALPVASGGTGSGTASGGAVGVIDNDDFERTSSSNLGALWTVTYSGGSGTWATPNSHDATFATSGTSDRNFLCIRNNPAILRSQTDYQRVTMELSSKAERFTDLLHLYDFTGFNDVWLRVSDDTTTLLNITGIRIRWAGDGRLQIHRFVSGGGTLLASTTITPPGPGAQLIGEAGVLVDGAIRYFRAKIGTSIRLGVQEVGTASGLGAVYRRWGHGGLAEGHLLPLPGQERPGGLHYWNGMDQTL